MTQENQRQSARVSTNLDGRLVTAQTKASGAAEDAKISNISLSGVFIETSTPAEVGEVVEFDVVSPDGNQLVKIVGKVIWRKEDEPRGFGVEFLNVG